VKEKKRIIWYTAATRLLRKTDQCIVEKGPQAYKSETSIRSASGNNQKEKIISVPARQQIPDYLRCALFESMREAEEVSVND
jgi:hypothetical protein